MSMHEVKVILWKGCGNCEAMLPELQELSKEIPVKFMDAETIEGAKEISRTGLPQVILPLINVDGRDLLMGHHSNSREKILTSLVSSHGLTQRLEKVIIEKQSKKSENVFCVQDIEINMQTGEKVEKKERCSWREPQ